MSLVIGVDSSTQSVKVEIRDLDSGVLLSTGRGTHPPTTPPKSEQDPLAWWDALQGAIHQGLNLLTATQQSQIVAVSVAGQQHGMVALDSTGAAVHPGKLWNDTESSKESDGLIDALGAATWATRTGSVPVPAFTITKIAWLAANHPESYARMTKVMLPHDVLTFYLTGVFATDRGDASGTGYWSPRDNAYDTAALGLIDGDRNWPTHLPTVFAPTASVGVVLPDVGAALGFPDGVIVGPGTGDNMAAALGLGLSCGDAVISLGTSGTVYAVSEKLVADATGTVAGFADATGRFLPLVCTLNATKVIDAFARLLGLGYQAFDDLALATPAGAGGVVLLPYLDGERTPNRPDATGVLSGIRSDVSRGQLTRAAIEGVVCGLLDGLDALTNAGVETNARLLLIGGGAKSKAFRQVVADLSQRTVVVPEADEHVATGAALQAAVVWRHAHGDPIAFDALARVWKLGSGVEVRPVIERAEADAVRAAYAALRERN